MMNIQVPQKSFASKWIMTEKCLFGLTALGLKFYKKACCSLTFQTNAFSSGASRKI